MKHTRNKSLDIVATISTSRMSRRWIHDLRDEGATFFRINGAFGPFEDVHKMVQSLKRHLGPKAPIVLDIPRNKVRLSQTLSGSFSAGKPIELKLGDVNFPQFFEQIKKGDVLYAKDSKYRFVVEKQSKDSATMIAKQDVVITPGMGMHRLGGWDGLPLFTDRDNALFKIASEYEIPYLGISYLRHAHEIPKIKAAIGKSVPIFKIETHHAYQEVNEIVGKTEFISIDRGDLSSEIGIENIHTAAQRILYKGKTAGNHVIMATQFLQNMILNPLPSISEVTSLHEAFEDGVDGIQLSEETAGGAFAVESVRWVKSLFTTWETNASANLPGVLEGSVLWMTGLSGSGKTTLARMAETRLREMGLKVALLDGDEVRASLDGIFGYEEKERVLNQKNLIYLAQKLSENRMIVIVASLSPYAELRRLARKRIPKFIEIYVKCSLEECRRRDPKNIYARIDSGSTPIPFVGINQHYETPEHPDYVIDTEHRDISQCLDELISHFISHEVANGRDAKYG